MTGGKDSILEQAEREDGEREDGDREDGRCEVECEVEDVREIAREKMRGGR
jgi:hypothetical protein